MFNPRRRGGHRGHRGPGLAMALLVGQMAQVGFNNIPPVTLVAIAGQVVAYLRLLNIQWPSTSEVCVSAVHVWYRQEYERIFLAAVFHADEWHLYFNMVSLLWKGLKLEPKVGSGYFLYMIAVFTALTNAMYIALSLGAEHVFHDPSYLSTCAVGFSGVLFALKVVATHMSPPGVHRIMGFIPVPSRYACWAELVLIHIMVPRASFVGHLAGILVGLMYVRGPLKPIMDTIIVPQPSAHTYASPGSWFNFGQNSAGPAPRQSRYRNWASSDRSHGSEQYDNHPPHEYTGGMDEDEQMQHAMRESLRDYPSPSVSRAEPSAPPMEPDLDPTNHANPTGYPEHTPSSGSGLYPDLSAMHENQSPNPPQSHPSVSRQEMDDLRQRRLRRFENQK